jgi:hypothetical protein
MGSLIGCSYRQHGGDTSNPTGPVPADIRGQNRLTADLASLSGTGDRRSRAVASTTEVATRAAGRAAGAGVEPPGHHRAARRLLSEITIDSQPTGDG